MSDNCLKILKIKISKIRCELPDWKPDPSKLAQLKNPALKEWANHLNGEWKKLCRRIPDKVGKVQSVEK